MSLQVTCECGKSCAVGEEHAGKSVRCPACSRVLIVPALPAPAARDEAPAGAACPYCHTGFGPDEALATCPECGTRFHAECWNEGGGCAVYGCPRVPPTQPRSELEIPPAVWGQERKPCPKCGQEILAAALRCRHCGATFSEARVEGRSAYQKRVQLEEGLPKVRRAVVWLFVLNAVTCTAPLAAVIGLAWYLSHRTHVRALPAIYGALCVLGLGLGFLQIAIMTIAGIGFSLAR